MSECPHCAAGNVPRWRSATREWTHDYVDEVFTLVNGVAVMQKVKGAYAHTLCLAKKDAP